MKIRSVTIAGFKSFREEVKFELPDAHGLYFVSGRNIASPELGANAVGKSSLWDAVVWCLYGKTARGVKAKGIANWDSGTKPVVTVVLHIRDTRYEVTRTWSPNTLTMIEENAKPETVDQERLNSIIGFDFDGFMTVVVRGQHSPYFFDLSATEKLAVFTRALELDVWIEASKRSSAAARELKMNDAATSASLEDAKDAVKDHEAEVAILKQDLKGEKKLAKGARDLLRRGAETLTEDIKQLSKTLKRSTKQADDHRDSLSDLEESTAKAFKRVTKYTNEMIAANADVKGCDRDLEAIDNRIAAAEGMDTCPTCRREVKPTAREDIIAAINVEREWVVAERVKVKAKHDEAEAKVSKYNTRRTKYSKRIIEEEDALRKAQAALVGISRQVALLKSDLVTNEAEIKAVNKRLKDEGSTGSALRRREAELRATSEKVVGLQESLEASDAALYEEWGKRFKDIRLWLVDKALEELEIEVNNSLEQLGLRGWVVNVSAERENDAGKVMRGFTVTVTSPTSVEPVAWESWSGGETRRLRVAGNIALATLIAARSGASPEVEVWDEPTGGLSREGTQDLLEFLATRADQEKKQIWLIDHQSIDFGGFAGEVEVQMPEGKGSQIVWKEGREQLTRVR